MRKAKMTKWGLGRLIEAKARISNDLGIAWAIVDIAEDMRTPVDGVAKKKRTRIKLSIQEPNNVSNSNGEKKNPTNERTLKTIFAGKEVGEESLKALLDYMQRAKRPIKFSHGLDWQYTDEGDVVDRTQKISNGYIAELHSHKSGRIDYSRSIRRSVVDDIEKYCLQTESGCVLLQGEGGIGKSTILLQLMESFNKSKQPFLYVNLKYVNVNLDYDAEFRGYLSKELYLPADQIYNLPKIYKAESEERLVVLLDTLDYATPTNINAPHPLAEIINIWSKDALVMGAIRDDRSHHSYGIDVKKDYRIEPWNDEEISNLLREFGQEPPSSPASLEVLSRPIALYLWLQLNQGKTGNSTGRRPITLLKLWEDYWNAIIGSSQSTSNLIPFPTRLFVNQDQAGKGDANEFHRMKQKIIFAISDEMLRSRSRVIDSEK